MYVCTDYYSAFLRSWVMNLSFPCTKAESFFTVRTDSFLSHKEGSSVTCLVDGWSYLCNVESKEQTTRFIPIGSHKKILSLNNPNHFGMPTKNRLGSGPFEGSTRL